MSDCPHYLARADGERLYCTLPNEHQPRPHEVLSYDGFVQGEPPADLQDPVLITWISGTITPPWPPEIPWTLEDFIDEDRAREANKP